METPQELRLGYKILKDAGLVPPEVEAFQRLARLREELSAAADAPASVSLRKEIAALEQHLSILRERFGSQAR